MNMFNMLSYARILIVVCGFLCLTLNYTFPLHRESFHVVPYETYYNGNQNQCEDLENHKQNTLPRLKKGAITIKINKKTKHSTPDDVEDNISPINSTNKNVLKNIDLRQYEQLVIMKKYPYLDIKELDMKYRPSGKTARHSSAFHSGFNMRNEPSICEQAEELLNVEINNRGLSGFAIPIQPLKHSLETKNNPKNYAITKFKDIHRVNAPDKYKLGSLKQKLLNYLDTRDIF